MLGLNASFPSFRLPAYYLGNVSEVDNSIHDKWAVIFFYPADFTPICASEIKSFNEATNAFNDRDCRILGISTDSIESHSNWLSGMNINYLIASDNSHAGLTYQLGILNDGKAERVTYIVAPDGLIKWICVHDKLVGRSVTETLRVLDALQSGELCECPESEKTIFEQLEDKITENVNFKFNIKANPSDYPFREKINAFPTIKII